MSEGIGGIVTALKQRTIRALYEVDSGVDLLDYFPSFPSEEEARIVALNVDEPLTDALLNDIGPNFARAVRQDLTSWQAIVDDLRASRSASLENTFRGSGLAPERQAELLQRLPFADEEDVQNILKNTRRTPIDRKN